jgi:hypothetical protein
VCHPVQHKVGTNEARPASNQNSHAFSFKNCILEALAVTSTAVKVRFC